jgi:hypothetical protein
MSTDDPAVQRLIAREHVANYSRSAAEEMTFLEMIGL